MEKSFLKVFLLLNEIHFEKRVYEKKVRTKVTSCLDREDWQMKRINRPALSNNRKHTLLPRSFFTSLPFYFAISSSSYTSHFALIQLCICILNDSITWDPAVKITDVFHYFSPLGHHDPSPAPITPLLPFIPLSRPLSPPVLFSSSPTVDKRLFCSVYLRGNNS